MNNIAAMEPVNSVARRVTSEGFKYTPDKKILCYHSHLPPKVIKLDIKAEGWVDLTGVKFGRFTVIGNALDYRGRWVVRCCCGMYELRGAKAIKNKENWGDRCGECAQLAYLKKKDEYNRLGENQTDLRDF